MSSSSVMSRSSVTACPDGSYTGPRWPWLTGPAPALGEEDPNTPSDVLRMRPPRQ